MDTKQPQFKRFAPAVAAVHVRACWPAALPLMFMAVASASEVSGPTIVVQDQALEVGAVVAEEFAGHGNRIRRHRLTRADADMGSVLRQEVGVAVRQSGGFGSFTSLSIRGSSGAQNAVYLDGVLLNNGGNSDVDLGMLEMLNLDAIDIYRGSTPAQLSLGGIGGAINLVSASSLTTNKQDNADGSRFQLNLGAHGRRGLNIAHQQRLAERGGRFLVSGGVQHSDNEFPFLNENGTPFNNEDDRRERRQNAEATRASLLLDYRHENNPDRIGILRLQLSDRHQGVPDWRNNASNNASLDNVSSQLQAALLARHDSGWNSRHSLYWRRDTNDYDDQGADLSMVPTITRQTTNAPGLVSFWEKPTDQGTLTLSGEWRHESLDSRDQLDPERTIDQSRQQLLFSGGYAWFSPNERWMLNPVLRWQGYRGKDTGSAQKFSPQLGITRSLGSNWELRANAGQYFRLPSFGELYGSWGLFRGNPDLEAEEGRNVDIGLHYQNDDASHISVTAFHNKRRNLIANQFNAQGVGRPFNAGRTEVRGLEFTASRTLQQQWRVSGNYTWQDSEVLDQSRGFAGKAIPLTARHSAVARVEYLPSRPWSVWYEFEMNLDRYYDSANLLVAEDSRLHAVGGSYQYNKFTVRASINNLSDQQIEDFNGYPKPGRSWHLALSRTF